jgi:hypothetical protein
MKDHREDLIESAPGSTTIDAAPASSPDPGTSATRRSGYRPDSRDDEPPVSAPAGPSACEGDDEVSGVLRAVEAELRRREMPVLVKPSGTVCSSCPSGHRSGPAAFEARIDERGSIFLRCHRCDRSTRELLALLGLAGPGGSNLGGDDRVADEDRVETLLLRPNLPIAPSPIGTSRHGGVTSVDYQNAAGFMEGDVLQFVWSEDFTCEDLDEGSSVERFIGRFPIKAVGKRPEDYRVRDLMHGSCFRIPRLQRFARLSRHPQPWQIEATQHLPEEQRSQAWAHLALRRDHLGGLHRLTAKLPFESEGFGASGYINRLTECPPHGVLLDGEVSQLIRKICKRKRVCPWCLARWSEDYFQRLMAGPCRPAEAIGKMWVMGRLTVTEDEDVKVLTRDRVQLTHKRWGGALTRWATNKLGSVGGILIHQIGPPRGLASEFFDPDDFDSYHYEKPTHSFEHDITILCEVPQRNEADHARFRKTFGLDQEVSNNAIPIAWDDQAEIAQWEDHDHDHIEVDQDVIKVTAIMGPRPNGLRYLWFGTSFQTNREDRTIFQNLMLSRQSTRLGRQSLDGAVRMQPWWLFNTMEWISYAAATKRLHLAEAFGTWIGRIPRRVTRPSESAEIDRLFGPEARRSRLKRRARAAGRQKMALPHVARNLETARAASDERKIKLESARPIFRRLTLENGGRPPGRERLRQAMAAEGITIGPTVAEEITRRLKAEGAGVDPD